MHNHIIYIYVHILYAFRAQSVCFISDITFCVGSICTSPVSSRHGHGFIWVGCGGFVGQGYDPAEQETHQRYQLKCG